MLKSALRFSLLLLLCILFVYAPEIFASVSSPYSLNPPQRVLLRIALNCDSTVSAQLQRVFSSYQKQAPAVHLRIVYVSADRLETMPLPHPDIILCPEDQASRLPAGFICAVRFMPPHSNHAMLCAVSSVSASAKTAQQFAAYIDEAFASVLPSPQI